MDRTEGRNKREEIKINHCRNRREGIQVFPETSTDYKKLTKMLDDHKQQYYTFKLDEEKPLRVVLRAIPEVISISEIREESTDRI